MGAGVRAALVVLLMMVVVGPAAAERQPFRVVNLSAEPAVALHAVRSGRPDWGGNLLNRAPLPPGGSFALRPAEGAGCRFDIRLVLTSGQEIIRRNTDICTEITVIMAPPPKGGGERQHHQANPASPPAATKPPQLEQGSRQPLPRAPEPPVSAQPNPMARVSSGSGFIVAAQRVLTNHHVIDGCSRILVRNAESRFLPATIEAEDPRRDLALLRLAAEAGPPLAFRANPVRRGEGVVTYGFPLAGLLSSGPTLTTGEVSALSGLGDNPLHFQISAPVQQGNSGGPLLDRQGHVIGVIVSKLNAARVAQRTGDIPQNVNFAIKGAEAIAFLRQLGVEPLLRESPRGERPADEVGEIAHPSTVFIRCER